MMMKLSFFYIHNHLNKSGGGPGGKFNGPSIKTVINKLEDLSEILPTESFPFVEYIKSIKELHKIFISEEFYENYDTIIDEFKYKFDKP